MRFLHIKLVGYVGFYSVMGLDSLEIDFTKCKHNVILIHGKNGSGKSTLMNALNPFPDPSSMYMSNRDAEKHITIANLNDIYQIHIFSKCKANGGRETTKAYVQKNGCELNENGNVNSFKDIIFSEFELDSNYVSLMQLSGTNRGLGSKTPAERKKFVANILGNMETYNNMHKTLNKKSLIYKSHVNTLSTKIQNIGSRELLEARLAEIGVAKSGLLANITDLNNKIVSLQTKVSIDDEATAKELEELSNNYMNLSSSLELLNSQKNPIIGSLRIKESEVQSQYEADSRLLEEYQKQHQDANTDNQVQLANYNSLHNSISELEASLAMNESDIDMNLEYAYSKSKEDVKAIHDELSNTGFDPDKTDVDALKELLEIGEKFIQGLDLLYDGMDNTSILMVEDHDPNKIKNLKAKLDSMAHELEIAKTKYDDLVDISKKISILDNRPKNCKISSCYFIKDSIELKNELGNRDIFEEIATLQDEMITLSNESAVINDTIDAVYLCIPKCMDYGILKGYYQKLIALYKRFKIKMNPDFLSRIHNMDKFNEIRDSSFFADYYNGLMIYKTKVSEMNNLETSYNNNRDKIKFINSTKNMIEKKKEELQGINRAISQSKANIDKYQDLISSLNTKLERLKNLISLQNQIEDVEKNINAIKDKMKELHDKSSGSVQIISSIEKFKTDILELQNSVKPLQEEENTISGQLTMLDSYNSEYQEYRSSYDLIETLKKYCSPTNGGIQTIFMQIYMSKTLEICNQILAMMFNGEYRLLDFIINENEFRIPFIGSRLPVDDISSGSTSQICIMGMIINLVLAHQASSTFNIPKLDEVDGGLDHRNRYEFINTLYSILPMLNIEQVFIVSHSMETDASAVDLIQLLSYSDHEGDVVADNVIWNYYEDARGV